MPRPFQLNPPPEYLQSRMELFTKLKTEYDAKLAGKYTPHIHTPPSHNTHIHHTHTHHHPHTHTGMERTPIKITLPDGKEVEGKAWETTPYDIAATIR